MNDGNDSLLLAQGLSARRGHRTVLEACDIHLRRAERVAVYGPNGAGKSTLLQALAALIPASGRISFQGKELGREMPLLDYHRRTAAVFQEPLLLWGTVRDNVRLGLELRGEKEGQQAKVDAWLDRLRIAHLADRQVGALSGGEAQRASLARALVLDPDLLFLDEPFSALDAPTRLRLTDEVADVLMERRVATVLVTHDIQEAAALCDRCLIVDHGRVLQDDTMEAVLHRPSSARVAQIVGTPNLLQGNVVEGDADGGGIWWNGQRLVSRIGEKHPTGPSDFIIRQELMHLTQASGSVMRGPVNSVTGVVERIRRSGPGLIVSVRADNAGVLQVPGSAGLGAYVGQAVRVSFVPEAIWIIPSAAASGSPAAFEVLTG